MYTFLELFQSGEAQAGGQFLAQERTLRSRGRFTASLCNAAFCMILFLARWHR